jgi:tetratricopeptide (TPR) repeat protein
MASYQVFLSYSSADAAAVESIACRLREVGIGVFFDRWDLVPGEPWQEALEGALGQSDSCAVFLGSADPGPWHNEEVRAALDRRTHNPSFRVIPVLLPGAVQPPPAEMPSFLRRLHWVDFGRGLDDEEALRRLVSGIRGIAPGAAADTRAARQALAALPVEQLPEPASLPSGSRMPLIRNPLFVGRDADLRVLARQLKAGSVAAVAQVQVAAATGLGGIGKTQLACEFVYRYGQFFAGGVYWISFADPAAIPVEVADCGRSMGLFGELSADALDHQVRLVEQAWRKPPPRLLVFDNCEDEELLQRWRPVFEGVRVLVTSRRGDWDPTLGVQVTRLDILARGASLQLLRLFRPDLAAGDAALDAIAEELGDLPLALHLAGSFLRTYRGAAVGNPASYLESLRSKNILAHPSLRGRGAGPSPTKHETDVGRTFDLSYERLDAADPADALAASLLARIAWFAPGEPIPRGLLLDSVQADPGDLAGSLLIEDALNRLKALGLIDANDQGDMAMHRLIALWAQGVAGSEQARQAVDLVLVAAAGRDNETRNPATLLPWQPHLRAAADRALARQDEAAARLAVELGHHLWLAGDYARSKLYLEKAIAIQQVGPESVELAFSLNLLGSVLNYQDLYAEAIAPIERALAIRTTTLGPEHRETAQCLNDLGYAHHLLGHLEQARQCLERALAIREKVLGPDHPETGRSLANFGNVLRGEGHSADAESLLGRAIAIYQKSYGLDHPDTAIALINMGWLRSASGDPQGARALFERALSILERVLGPEHPVTANASAELGKYYSRCHDFLKARRYLLRAQEIFTLRLGPDNARTKAVRQLLSQLPGARRIKNQKRRSGR